MVFDAGFKTLNLTLRDTEAALNTYAGTGTTMGATVGDVVVAIDKLTTTQQARINNNDMIFTHAGKTHVVANYTDRGTYATVELNELSGSNINSDAGLFAGNGIAADLRYSPQATRTIPLSLQDGEAGNITVGISTIQTNGNAAFPGITTLGSPGGGSEVIINNRLTVNSGANITGIATLAQAYIAKLAQSNGTSGSVNEVPVANGSGGWSWAPVNTAGASVLQGITVQEEGSNVGTAGSIATINFVGNDVTADATAQQGICTVTIDSNIQGITTSGTSFLHDITQTGVTTITSDQEAAINVGTSATIYKLGNIRTVGVITARGGLVISDSTDRSSNGGLIVGTAGTIQSNGAAAFAGIVTAGGGFNIGIQSAGIVIAKNVGINTLNFVGSGNSITYFAATNTLDVSIAGSSGGGGGVSETSTSVSTTSATSCGSFAKASKRSASVLAQITQGSAYQVGRYLVIHDGTTVTTVEESAVATGSMLGTFEGVINGNDVEFRVTMSSSSSATVITKIDSISS